MNGYLGTEALSGPTTVGGDANNPFGLPFSTAPTLDFAHTVLLSGAAVSLAGQLITTFALLDEAGNARVQSG